MDGAIYNAAENTGAYYENGFSIMHVCFNSSSIDNDETNSLEESHVVEDAIYKCRDEYFNDMPQDDLAVHGHIG